MEADVRAVDNQGFTPMLWACTNGHLPVCEWLLGVGAADDIRTANVIGRTPMLAACTGEHMPVCQCLVLNGAMNQLDAVAGDNGGGAESAAASAAESVSTAGGGAIVADGAGRINRKLVEVGTLLHSQARTDGVRTALLAWADNLVAVHDVFLNVVLRASILVPVAQMAMYQDRGRCTLPRLPREVLERIGAWLGVEIGERLRNVHEFAEALRFILRFLIAL